MSHSMLDPIVDRLQRWHVPRLLASIVVVFGLLGAAGAGGTFLWPQIDSVLTKVPQGAEQLRRTFRQQRRVKGDSALERIQAAAQAVDSAAAEATPASKSPGVTRVEVQQPWPVSDMLWTRSIGMFGLLAQGMTVLFLTIFLLYEDDGRSFAYRKGAWMGLEMAWRDRDRRFSIRLAPGSRMLPPNRRPLEVRVAGGKTVRTVTVSGAPVDVRL